MFNIVLKNILEGKTNIPDIVWHISNQKFKKFSRQYAAQGIFWFAKDKEDLLNDFHGAGVSTNKPIWLYECRIKVKNPAGWDEYEKYGLGQIEDMGFDSIDLDDDFVVFNEKDIKILNIEQVN